MCWEHPAQMPGGSVPTRRSVLNKTAPFTDLTSICLTQPSFKKGFGHFWVYPLCLTDSSGVQAVTWGSGDWIQALLSC